MSRWRGDGWVMGVGGAWNRERLSGRVDTGRNGWCLGSGRAEGKGGGWRSGWRER